MRWWCVAVVAAAAVAAAVAAAEAGQEGHTARPRRAEEEEEALPASGGPRSVLAESKECKADVVRLCGYKMQPPFSDLAVVDCVQNHRREEDADLSERCHHLLWTYRRNLTTDGRFLEAAEHVCSSDMKILSGCKEGVVQTEGSEGEREERGQLLACVVEQKDSVQDPLCRQFLTKVQAVIFSDYRLVHRFAKECDEDIRKLQCGRMDRDNKTIHSQGRTVECLSQNVQALSPACKHQILRVSELQAEDFHLDRPLYFACRDARERFCSKVSAGEGRVYKCLLRHKMERDMAQACREQLSRRQRIVVQDYKASRGLAKACKEDIRTYHCRRSTSDDKDIRLAQILLCLEGAIRQGNAVSEDCQAEMIDHRKALLEDYRLSPELVSECADDMLSLCKGLGAGGRTIHCLMDAARARRRRSRLTDRCLRALESVLKEADVGEDWRVDPVLKEACQPVVDMACTNVRGGDARVMSCLMEKLGSPQMVDACETALLQIQYFVSRDFKLEPQLFRMCLPDAVKLCHAKKYWNDDPSKMDPERGPMVLPCLYRYAYHPSPDLRLQTSCLQEVRRVMRQRALRVELQPQLQEPCLQDLASLCAERLGRGEEIVCLQDHLEQLQEDCRVAVGNWTEDQSRHADLNPQLLSMCRPLLDRFCVEEMRGERDEGGVAECLAAHKNEPEARSHYKCRAAIEHMQLLALKDYHFSFKFKAACKRDVSRYCTSAGQSSGGGHMMVRSKADVVRCLAGLVRNDTLQEHKHRVSRECRQQLRVQLLRQRESPLQLDPRLQAACGADARSLCTRSLQNSGERLLECLRLRRQRLSALCHRELFALEQDEAADNSLDLVLTTACRGAAAHLCPQELPQNLLECLKTHRADQGLDARCRAVLVRRLVEHNSDYRLNRGLRKACLLDIPKFCSPVITHEPADMELQGKVIQCLKEQLPGPAPMGPLGHYKPPAGQAQGRLSAPCHDQVLGMVREAALDFRLDVALAAACREDVHALCSEAVAAAGEEEDEDGRDEDEEQEEAAAEGDGGRVEECLKEALQARRIRNLQCQVQVARLIQGGRADIHSDPLLHRTCSVDLNRYCLEVDPGDGRKLACLLDMMSQHPSKLGRECKEMLDKRMEMYESAAHVAPPNSVGELYHQVSRSPSRNYFLVMACSLLGVMFIMGLFCGRVTKRVRASIKRK